MKESQAIVNCSVENVIQSYFVAVFKLLLILLFFSLSTVNVRLIILTERLPDSMTLYLCLPLLAVLLKPAVCLYTCSSEYNRTPGGLTRSWITFNPLLNIMDFFLFLSLKQQMDHHLHKHLNLLFVALLQTIQTCQLTVAPV